MDSDFVLEVKEEKIIRAIEEAELGTSGEIRVHLEPNCNGEVLDRASEVFAELHMHKTKLRNGVLFYIAYDTQQFAIIGDHAINAVVPENFWNEEKEILSDAFNNLQFTDGICEGIKRVGDVLGKHFPYKDDLSGELPNEISYGE